MQITLNKLHGYHRHFRGRFLLIINKTLTEEEYVLWDISFSSLSIWDKEHYPDRIGTFSYSQKEIAKFLGWGESKVSRCSKKLFALGLWSKDRDGNLVVNGYSLLSNLGPLSKGNKRPIDILDHIPNSKLKISNNKHSVSFTAENAPDESSNKTNFMPQSNTSETSKASLISFKSKSIDVDSVDLLRPMEEYEKIIIDGNFTFMTVEDLIWIDKYLYRRTGLLPT